MVKLFSIFCDSFVQYGYCLAIAVTTHFLDPAASSARWSCYGWSGATPAWCDFAPTDRFLNEIYCLSTCWFARARGGFVFSRTTILSMLSVRVHASQLEVVVRVSNPAAGTANNSVSIAFTLVGVFSHIVEVPHVSAVCHLLFFVFAPSTCPPYAFQGCVAVHHFTASCNWITILAYAGIGGVINFEIVDGSKAATSQWNISIRTNTALRIYALKMCMVMVMVIMIMISMNADNCNKN